jgi:hypothetical protein
MVMSQEELVIHDSQVVCPQCLAVCRYIDGALVVKDDSDAPYRHTANVDIASSKQESTKFCHSCGKKLPSGIKFCPYCGADLSAPFSQPKTADVKPEPSRAQTAAQEKKPAAKAERTPQPEQRLLSHNQVEDKLRTISRRYNNGMRPQLHQNGTMPSRTFKIVAYCVILVLLIVLVCFIVAGLNIEPAI